MFSDIGVVICFFLLILVVLCFLDWFLGCFVVFFLYCLFGLFYGVL